MNEAGNPGPRPSRIPSLAVVVPMLNERAGAEACVGAISDQVARLATAPRTFLVVVDDGSSDGTEGLLDDLAKSTPCLNVVHHEHNMGYGSALRSGALEADRLGAEWVLFMDSDLTNPAADISRFVSSLSDDVDYIKGTRYSGGGGMRGVPLKRQLVSRMGNAFGRRLLGLQLSDVTNGFRAIRTRVFLEMPLKEQGFALIMEEAYWAQRMGLGCAEIPTILTSRELGRSSFHYRPSVLYSYARYPIKSRVSQLWRSRANRVGRKMGALR